MTYRELKAILEKMNETQLDCDVVFQDNAFRFTVDPSKEEPVIWATNYPFVSKNLSGGYPIIKLY